MWIGIVVFALILLGISIGWGEDLARRLRNLDAEFGRRRSALESEHRVRVTELDAREAELVARGVRMDARDTAVKQSMCRGRQWLATLIADADAAVDESRATILAAKDRPAPVAAEVVRRVRSEKRELRERLKFVEYQLASYEEYFPMLTEYREVILDERVPLGSGRDNLGSLEDADPVVLFVSQEEYDQLSDLERNELALERYLSRDLADWEVGRMYERFLGWRHEVDGWAVSYQRALRGFDDLGRDLICRKDSQVRVVQAKCWSRRKAIHEKHVFQLYGSAVQLRLSCPQLRVAPVLAVTTDLSPVAAQVALDLGVAVERVPLDKSYPMIKCNVSLRTGDRIYHLPFDQQYDRIVIGNRAGECYVRTVREAERKGFRRAWRYRGGDAD